MTIERCEFDPETNTGRYEGTGCTNDAMLSVGADRNNWHLCETCAALPYFKRLRSRFRLREPT